MDDLVRTVIDSRAGFVPVFRNLMDVDFYQFTMANLIFQFHRNVGVKFEVINRDPTVPLANYISEAELDKHLNHACLLRFSWTDLAWLRGMRNYGQVMFSEQFIDYLAGFALPKYRLTRNHDQFELSFEGPWFAATFWETIAPAIISALYYRKLMSDLSPLQIEMTYVRAKDRLYTKLLELRRRPTVTFADFATRRRHSFEWQQWAISAALEVLGRQVVGTSNTWMAFHFGVMPIGTNAHSVPMVYAALADSSEERVASQYQVLRDWESLYGGGLRIMLPDTFGTQQFLDRPESEAFTHWRGFRQDSGKPIEIARLYQAWWTRHGINPLREDKLVLFTDGQDLASMTAIDEYLGPALPKSFGWGTMLANDFRGCYPDDGSNLFRPFSLVCKVTEANGRPCVKLSDNPAKATGLATEVERYRREFGCPPQERIELLV